MSAQNCAHVELLRRAKELAGKAATLDWNEDRNVMLAVHLAADIGKALMCPRCDDTGTKDYAGFAMEPCDNPDCRFVQARVA